MNDAFADYVAGFEDLLARGRALAAAVAERPQLPALQPGAPVCLVFSPHPDDEAICGALPWRLRLDGWRVVNVAVTLGSRRERRAQRWLELTRSCSYLGFELVSAAGEPGRGLERISAQCAADEPAHWADCLAHVAALLERYRPRVVVCPHAQDGHPAHMGTHALVADTLQRHRVAGPLQLALSEYWNTQMEPRLMVELGGQDVARLVAALCLHAGEVARNPYHLSLPAWFMDGVRRGAERVGAAGDPAPGFAFAALYGWQRWEDGVLVGMPGRPWPLRVPSALVFA